MTTRTKYVCKCPSLKQNTNGPCDLQYTYRGHLMRHITSKHAISVNGLSDSQIQTNFMGIVQVNEGPPAPKKRKISPPSPVSIPITQIETPVVLETPVDDNLKDIKDRVVAISGAIIQLSARLKKMENKEKKVCIACWTYESNHALVPCGHKVLCGTCAAAVYQRNPVCPICREQIRDILQVWDNGMPLDTVPELPTQQI